MSDSSQSSNRYFLHGSSAKDSWINSSESWLFKAATIIAAAVVSLMVHQLF
jgi:hypothetical protein